MNIEQRKTCVNVVTQTELECSIKARQLDRWRVSRRRQDDKLWLNAAVNDSVVVAVADGFQQLSHVVTDNHT